MRFRLAFPELANGTAEQAKRRWHGECRGTITSLEKIHNIERGCVSGMKGSVYQLSWRTSQKCAECDDAEADLPGLHRTNTHRMMWFEVA